MNVIEKIISFVFLIGWIIAPLIVHDILLSRDIILPTDLGTYGVVIWYGIGLGQTIWINRKDSNYWKKDKKSRPSYTDKGLDDWTMKD